MHASRRRRAVPWWGGALHALATAATKSTVPVSRASTGPGPRQRGGVGRWGQTHSAARRTAQGAGKRGRVFWSPRVFFGGAKERTCFLVICNCSSAMQCHLQCPQAWHDCRSLLREQSPKRDTRRRRHLQRGILMRPAKNDHRHDKATQRGALASPDAPRRQLDARSAPPQRLARGVPLCAFPTEGHQPDERPAPAMSMKGAEKSSHPLYGLFGARIVPPFALAVDLPYM